MNTLEQELAGEVTPTSVEKENKKARTQWNYVQISGRIVTEIAKKTVKEQTVITFTLLFETQRKTDKDGSHANFIEVELWGKMAELFYPLLSKGLEVMLTGELYQQRWIASDGKKAQKFSISAQSIVISDQKFRPN